MRSCGHGLEFLAIWYVLDEKKNFLQLTGLLTSQCQQDKTVINMSTFLKLMEINGNSGSNSQVFVCILTWLLFVTKNNKKVMFVWELECMQQGGSCGSLGMVLWEFTEQETKFPKGKIWELMLSGRQGQVNLHLPWLTYTKLLNRQGLPVSVFSSIAQNAKNLYGLWIFL